MEPKKTNWTLVIVILVVILAVASYGFYKYIRKNTPIAEVVVPEVKPRGIYKDGVYSAVGDYFSPGGDEQIDVQVTIKDDVIIEATSTPKATRPNSVKFQGIFTSNFKQFVIGKNIDEVKLDKVSGSSLTPVGFNDALSKIRVDAKV